MQSVCLETGHLSSDVDTLCFYGAYAYFPRLLDFAKLRHAFKIAISTRLRLTDCRFKYLEKTFSIVEDSSRTPADFSVVDSGRAPLYFRASMEIVSRVSLIYRIPLIWPLSRTLYQCRRQGSEKMD